jgi:uronate dehydrogenase
MSDNAVSWYDNASVRHVGYVPQDSSDEFREAIYALTPEPDQNDPTVQYQGGTFLMAGIPMTAHKNGK